MSEKPKTIYEEMTENFAAIHGRRLERELLMAILNGHSSRNMQVINCLDAKMKTSLIVDTSTGAVIGQVDTAFPVQ